MENCIFCKIINKEIPSKIVYEDEFVLAFEDIAPTAPVHVLVIPKKHIKSVLDLTESDSEVLNRIFQAINKVAELKQIKDTGFRVVSNCGKDAGQTVEHLHFHILGKKTFGESFG